MEWHETCKCKCRLDARDTLKIKHIIFFEDMINIKKFHLNVLKMEKTSYRDIDIYYTSYIMIKKFGDCENIHSGNLCYLIIWSATGHLKKKDEKCLILDWTDKLEEALSKIR